MTRPTKRQIEREIERRLAALEETRKPDPPAYWMVGVPRELWNDPAEAWRYLLEEAYARCETEE